MSIGLIGKQSKTRLITGSVHYGKRSREFANGHEMMQYGHFLWPRKARVPIKVGIRGTYTETKRPHRSR